MNAPSLARSFAMLTGVRTADLRDPADRARIDGFVNDHPRATPFHLAGWTAAVERGTGHRGHYLIAEHADGHVVGVLPLTASRSRQSGCVLVSAGFAGGGGILADTPFAADALADAAWATARRLGCPSVELRGGLMPADWTIDDATWLAFVRPLAATDAAELAALPRKRRAELRKALAIPFTIATGSGRRALAEHHAVYSGSMRGQCRPVLPARLMRSVVEAFGDAADVLTVRHGGTPVASVLSLYFRGTVHPCWGGGTPEAPALHAGGALYFALMAHARSRGCTRFDFGRSAAGTGAAAFRKNWGFAPMPLACAVRETAAEGGRVAGPRHAAGGGALSWLPLPVADVVGRWRGRGAD